MTGVKLNHPLLIGALGGVLAACMACGILATGVAMFMPTPTATPTAVIEPTPTTPPATPTITPVPTIVIQPTPTPAFSADEDAYVTSLRKPIEQLANGLVDTARLLQNPLGTPQWRAELRQAIQQLTNAHYDATRLTPPASWAAFHNQLTQATYQCSMAGDMIYSAISDTSYTQMAFVAMQRCTYLVADVSLELERRSRKP